MAESIPSPTFRDVEMVLLVRGRDRRVIVGGDLLKCLWSAFEGPQTAEELAEANRDLFAKMAECNDGEPIRLTSVDWEG